MPVDGEVKLEDSGGRASSKDRVAMVVDANLLMQGPAQFAKQLVIHADSSVEQADAVTFPALAMQQRSDARTIGERQHGQLLSLVSKAHNHPAIWLGGGGVGKTRTLELVVQP